jgi:hypothetical protein
MRYLPALPILVSSILLHSCVNNSNKSLQQPKDISLSRALNVKSPKTDSNRSATDTIITHLINDKGNDTIFYITHLKGHSIIDVDLIISLSDLTRKTFNNYYWDSIGSSFPPINKNSVNSNKVFVYKQKEGSALFLFTMGGEAEDGRVYVILVRKHFIRKTVDTSLFSFPVAFTDIDNDGNPEIIGRSYSEVLDTSGTIVTYDPNFVYTISDNGCRLNKGLTELYNKQHYVWAKRAVKDNVGVLHPKDKSAPYFVMLKTDPKTSQVHIIKLGKTVPDSLLQ